MLKTWCRIIYLDGSHLIGDLLTSIYNCLKRVFSSGLELRLGSGYIHLHLGRDIKK